MNKICASKIKMLNIKGKRKIFQVSNMKSNFDYWFKYKATNHYAIPNEFQGASTQGTNILRKKG